MTSTRSKNTPVLARCMILAAALVLTACSAAAAPVAAPVATQTATVQPADTAVPTADSGTSADPLPTDVPTDEPAATATVPVLPVVAVAWSPAPRTKTTGCVSQGGLPDPACTPGAIDPRVSIATATGTICTSGYTATVRPPVSVTDRIKREQMAAYGLQGQPLSGFELDHLISLELGGAPADVANLWPEPWNGDGNAHQKDAVETHLKRQVCSGTVSLGEAQRMIATDWVAVYRQNGLPPTP